MNLFRVFVNLFKFNRTNWKAVALCFLAATVFWFFNAINKDYATNVQFPLQFEYNHEKFVPTKALPAQVTINVSGSGWDLLRNSSYGLRQPTLTVPLERPTEVKKIVCSTLPPLFASQLGKLEINYLVTDTLFLQLESKDIHKFKIVFDEASVTFKDELGRISPIVILPDSIHMEGPKSLLHDLPDSIVLGYSGKRIASNFRESIEVTVDNEMIKRNPPVVEVMFEVGEVVQVERHVKVDVINKPTIAQLSLTEDSILCKVQIPKNRLEDFQRLPLWAEVELKKKAKGKYRVVPVYKGLPAYARLLQTDSAEVKLF